MTLTGRFRAIHIRNNWPAEIALAAQRFGETWHAAKAGDMESLFIVDMIERRSDEVDYMHFQLWSVFGVTFTEQHARGFGLKASISAAALRCAETAHSVYSGTENTRRSKLLTEGMDLLRKLQAR